MSSSRRVESNAANRKTFRAQAASPYSAKSRNTRKQSSSANAAASAAAGEIKTSSSLASLLNMLNPFKRRNDPPKSLPQIAHQQSHESVTEEEQTEGNTEDEYDMMGGDDSRFVEDELAAPPSAASTLNKRVEQPSHLPFPITQTPVASKSPGVVSFHQDALSPIQNRMFTPTSSHDTERNRRSLAPVPPTPAAVFSPSNPFNRPSRIPQSPRSNMIRSPLTLSQLGPPAPPPSKTKSTERIQNFIESRSNHGPLTPDETRKLDDLVRRASSSTLESTDHDADKPSAALLGRGFVPSPSKSFLAPRPPPPVPSSVPQSDFSFHVQPSTTIYTQLNGNPSATWSSTTTRTPRKRPVYVGPGMSSTTRPHRSSMLPKSSTLGSLSGLFSTGPKDSSLREDAEAQGTPNDGKRRKTDNQSGPSISSSQSMPSVAAPQVPSGSSVVTSTSSKPPATSSSSNIPRSSFYRGGATQVSTANPVHPSPLRTMTKPAESPSPPHIPKSRTSGAMMEIIKAVDPSYSDKPDALTNPYESKSRPVPVQIKSKRPPPKTRPAPPPKTDAKRNGRPSTGDVSSTSKKVTLVTPSEENASVGRKSTGPASQSSFLPPLKAKRPSTTTAPPRVEYTVDDVDMDDIEIIEAPVSNGKQNQANGKRGPSFAVTLPDVTIEELMDEDEEQGPQGGKANGAPRSNGTSTNGVGRRGSIKPSLVIEPEEPRRYGRSPSLGPRFHSPTIPSPLRHMSMPGNDDDTDSASGAENSVVENSMDIEVKEVAEQSDVMMKDVTPKSLPPVQKSKPASPPLPPQDEAKKVSLPSLPKFSFKDLLPPPSTAILPPALGEKGDARSTSITDLPKFDFGSFKGHRASTSLTSFAFIAPPAPPISQPAFDWAAVGMKPQVAAPGTWTCSVCACSNPGTATSKCTVCASDKVSAPTPAPAAVLSAPPPAPPVKAFDWSAAGMSVKSTPSGSWTCGTCGCSNPADAMVKCTVCETPK